MYAVFGFGIFCILLGLILFIRRDYIQNQISKNDAIYREERKKKIMKEFGRCQK
jgi:uncharacterized protein YneF (UPF0154 family)